MFGWVTNFYIPLKLCENITEVILTLCSQIITFLSFIFSFYCLCLNVVTFRTYLRTYCLQMFVKSRGDLLEYHNLLFVLIVDISTLFKKRFS